jgi:hypothetical protein
LSGDGRNVIFVLRWETKTRVGSIHNIQDLQEMGVSLMALDVGDESLEYLSDVSSLYMSLCPKITDKTTMSFA